MPIPVDDAVLPVTAAVACVALLSVVALRGCLYALGRVLQRLRCSPLRPLVELAVLVPSLLLIYLCLSFNTGVTLPVACLSASIAALLGWSGPSFRVLCVVCFAVLSLVVPHALSRGVEVAIGSGAPQWVSRYAGQHVRASNTTGLVLAPNSTCTAVTRRFLYHDHVSFAESTAALTEPAHVPRWLSWHPQRAAPLSVEGGCPWGGAKASDVASGELCIWPRELYASGDDTCVGPYGVPSATLLVGHRSCVAVDRVALLGDASTLHDAQLRCLLHPPNASNASTPTSSSSSLLSSPQLPRSCLSLAPSTQLRNVTVELYRATASGTTAASAACAVHIDTAQNCSAALALFTAAAARDCAGFHSTPSVLHCLDASTELASLESTLEAVAAPAAFRQAMPVTAALRRVLPAHAVKVRRSLEYVTESVLLPIARALAQVVPVLSRWLLVACQWVLSWLEGVWPYVQQWGASLARMAAGFLCGTPHLEADASQNTSAARPPPAVVNDTAAMANASAPAPSGLVPPPPTRWGFCPHVPATPSWEYTLGMQLHQSLSAAAAAVMDAVELVPGVWSAYRWAWNTEVALTRWCVQGLYALVRFVVEVLPVPLAKMSMRVTAVALRLVAVLAELLVSVAKRLGSSSLAEPVRRAARWLLEEEYREMRWEWALIRHLVALTAQGCGAGLRLAWQLVSVLYTVAHYGFSLYSSTSFTINFLVVLIQSAALLLNMRDEIRALMQREEEASRRRAQLEDSSALLQPANFLTRLWVRRVERNTTVTRFQGVLLFVKSYHAECARYVVFHLVVFFTLLGFSFLPFTKKLYRLTLHVILPWYSSYLYLSFSCANGTRPSRRGVLKLTLIKAAVTVALQRTVGDVLYRILRDLFIAVCLLATCVAAILAWPQRHRLAREVADVISDSLNPTPQRAPAPSAASRTGTPAPASRSSPPPEAPQTPPPPPPRLESEPEEEETKVEEEKTEEDKAPPPSDHDDSSGTGGAEERADPALTPPDVSRTLLPDSEDESPAEETQPSHSPTEAPVAASPPRTMTPPHAHSNSSSLFTEDDEDAARAEL